MTELEAKKLIESAKDFECPECGCKYFEDVTAFKVLNKLVSPTGNNELIPKQFLKCSKCGKIIDPQDILEKSEEPKSSLLI